MTSYCLCGKPATEFREYKDATGQTIGIVAVVDGVECCSAFTRGVYRGVNFALWLEEFNRRPTNLAYEAGVF